MNYIDQAPLSEVESALKEKMLFFCGRHESDAYFSVPEVAEIMKMVSGAFLQHYQLYSYVLGQDQPYIQHSAHCKVRSQQVVQKPLQHAFKQLAVETACTFVV